MNKLYNSSLENSLRVLLLLNSNKTEYYSLDKIVSLDFITQNSAKFSICDINLNGENSFYLGGYSNRREEIQEAIKTLLFKRLICVMNSDNGFEYKITTNGINLASELCSDYAIDYKNTVIKVIEFTKNLNEKQLLRLINKVNKE